MHNTLQLLEAVKTRHAVVSDYQLAKLLGITRSSVSGFRCKGITLGDELCIRVAELLEMDPAYVLACVHAERAAAGAVRSAWESFAKKAAGAAALVLLGCALPQHDAGAVGERAADHFRSLYIMLSGFLTRFFAASGWRKPAFPAFCGCR